jgi:hypothetical protein
MPFFNTRSRIIASHDACDVSAGASSRGATPSGFRAIPTFLPPRNSPDLELLQPFRAAVGVEVAQHLPRSPQMKAEVILFVTFYKRKDVRKTKNIRYK